VTKSTILIFRIANILNMKTKNQSTNCKKNRTSKIIVVRHYSDEIVDMHDLYREWLKSICEKTDD
jgi:hypothetical protein